MFRKSSKKSHTHVDIWGDKEYLPDSPCNMFTVAPKGSRWTPSLKPFRALKYSKSMPFRAATSRECAHDDWGEVIDIGVMKESLQVMNNTGGKSSCTVTGSQDMVFPKTSKSSSAFPLSRSRDPMSRRHHAQSSASQNLSDSDSDSDCDADGRSDPFRYDNLHYGFPRPPVLTLPTAASTDSFSNTAPLVLRQRIHPLVRQASNASFSMPTRTAYPGQNQAGARSSPRLDSQGLPGDTNHDKPPVPMAPKPLELRRRFQSNPSVPPTMLTQARGQDRFARPSIPPSRKSKESSISRERNIAVGGRF